MEIKEVISEPTFQAVVLGIVVFLVLSGIYFLLPALTAGTTYFAFFLLVIFPAAYMLSRMNSAIVRSTFGFFILVYVFSALPWTGGNRHAGYAPTFLSPPGWITLFLFGILLFYPKLKIRKYVSIKTILILTAPAILFFYFALHYSQIGDMLHMLTMQAPYNSEGVPLLIMHAFNLLFFFWWAFLASLTGLLMKSKTEIGRRDVLNFFRITRNKVLVTLILICLLAAVFVSLPNSFGKISWITGILVLLLLVLFLPLQYLLSLLSLGISTIVPGANYAPYLFPTHPIYIALQIIYIYILACSFVSIAKELRSFFRL